VAGYAEEVALDSRGPDFVVDDEIDAVEAVLDLDALAADVAEQVAVASSDGLGAVELTGRVADYVVNNVGGEGLERALDVTVGLPAEVVLEDPVNLGVRLLRASFGDQVMPSPDLDRQGFSGPQSDDLRLRPGAHGTEPSARSRMLPAARGR
jgi:hypothetical protein